MRGERGESAHRSRSGLALPDGDHLSEACALELGHAAIRSGVQPGGEVVHGRERALDRGGIRNGLRSKEVDPRQRDVEGAQLPAPSAFDGLTRLGEERAGP